MAEFDGYTTVDLQTRFQLPVGQLNVGLENLFGEQYVTYYSQSTPRNDTYVAGRGRVLTLSWAQPLLMSPAHDRHSTTTGFAPPAGGAVVVAPVGRPQRRRSCSRWSR